MKTYFCLLLLFVLLPFVVGAQQANSLSGKVLDGETGEPLPGTFILIKSEKTGTATDMSGNFVLPNLPRSKDTLVVSFIGYKQQEVNFDLSEKNYLRISLQPVATSLDEITIRASLEGQQKALNMQRSADNIKNVISADLISRFPDLNVAEALQRVPGVNISRARGEGSTISLRGTPKHFTTININGEQIPSTQNDGSRNESLDLIPADQLSSMEVTKALTPDMDGDAIGGSVNLKTPIAKTTDWSLRAEAGGGYNSLSQGFNGIGRFRIDRRFLYDEKRGEGKLGVMLGLSYFGTDNEEDSYEAAWSPFGDTPIRSLGADTVVIENYEYSDLINQRTRTGSTATLDYKFSGTSGIIFNFMYNRREDVDQRNRIRGRLNESAGVTWTSLDTILGTELRRDIALREYFSENLSYNLQGEHLIGNVTLDWGAFYADSRRVEEGLQGRFERGSDNRINLVTTTARGIYAELPEFRTLNPEQNFFDPFVITDADRYDTDDILLESSNFVGKFNLTIPFNLPGAKAYLKTGAKYRRQTNDKVRNNRIFLFSDPNRVINERAAFASVVSVFEDEDFMNDRARFGPSIDPELFRQFVNDNERLYRFDRVRTNRNTYNESYGASETIYAGYVMGRIEWPKLMLLGGLRFERNEVAYDAFEVNNISGDFSPLSDGTDYQFLLPNVHLKYSFNRFTNLRAAVTYSYARPNFSDLVPFLQIDEDGGNIRAGNPELMASQAVNVDLLFERYLANIGIISGGLFYKNIDDFQFDRRLQFTRPGDPFYEEFPGYSFRQTQNGENAQVYGFELNTQVPLDFLPGILGGFGTYFNYTFTESDAFTADRTGISLPGQARHTFNAALTFDYRGFTARGSLNYNGTFLDGVAGESRNDIVQLERAQLDINASYQLNSNFRVFAEFMNVTNAPSINYQGIPERISEFAYFGWWNRFGISLNL
ncbi:MAG: TonB-dependent receptor [Cyclobacteriaceae bacterium]